MTLIEKYILDRIVKKESPIVVNGSFTMNEFVKLIQNNIKYLPYITSFEIADYGFVTSKTKIDMTYIDFDFDFNDIFAVKKIDELNRLFDVYVKRHKGSCVVITKDPKMIDEATTKLIEDNWLSYPYFDGISSSDMNWDYFGYHVFYCFFRYHKSAEEIEKIERMSNQEAQKVANFLFEPMMPLEVKIYLAHNYLATSVKYDDESLKKFDPIAHLAYGAFFRRKCVCHGFADAFKRIVERGGVKCEIIAGDVDDMRHAWNIVTLKDGSYHVDVTFDIGDEPRYEYFMVTDSFMQNERTWLPKFFPKCNVNREIVNPVQKYLKENKDRLLRKGIPLKALDIK